MIPFPDIPVRLPDEQTMQDVYEKIKTPYKYGAVMKFDTALCDSPTVYHFYCACNTCGERFIALACSRDMQNT